jgi:LuxR family transcriptional regulator, maltose regulon positive regulatory protein
MTTIHRRPRKISLTRGTETGHQRNRAALRAVRAAGRSRTGGPDIGAGREREDRAHAVLDRRLHERTEGWAAGLRLAALSLTGHPDPERFAAEFSGTDRTVAEFLLAEVLDRQSEEVRRLLLRTSMLERVSGPLADVLTGRPGGERILQDLERAGAFVVSLDGHRSWFRYHQLFADLLRLELRRIEPSERAALHGAAAGWLAEHGHTVEAVRQAQAAESWELAARLLCDHWLDLYLGGRGAILIELLGRFPGRVVAASPELTAVQVAGDLAQGALADAGRHLAAATGALAAVPADRRRRVQVMLSVLRLFLARRRVDFPVVAEEPLAGMAYAQLGMVLLYQGRPG